MCGVASLARARRTLLTDFRYEYVRLFEQPDSLLANTWIVVRIDGRGFSKYVYCHYRPSSSSQVLQSAVLGHAGTLYKRQNRINLACWPQALDRLPERIVAHHTLTNAAD
jgi:hypothetical protein